MKYIDLLLAYIKNKPQEFFVGVGVFCVAVMGTSVNHVASTVFSLLLISSFFVIKDWSVTWKQLSNNEKWLLAGFSLYAFSGVLAFVNVQDVQEYIKDLERYVRFLAAVPIYLFVRKYKLNVIKYLYAGVVFSGPFLFYIAFSDYMENPNMPARGYYHHIIFGSVAMLNVGVMLAILLATKTNKFIKTVVAISMLGGFMAAVLSQSRGVWLVLPLYILVALYYSLKCSRARFGSMVIMLVLMGAALLTSPVGEMVIKRVDIAVDEVSAFYTEGQYISSLGTRLAMWEIAFDIWKQHPVVGSGPGDFDDIIRELQKEGKYVGMDVHGSTHNIYMQSLVNAGLFGFLTMLLAIFIMPLKIIMQSRIKNSDRSLLGFVFIILFATVGLSESWTLRLPTVSVYIIFLIVIISNMYLPEKNKPDKLSAGMGK